MLRVQTPKLSLFRPWSRNGESLWPCLPRRRRACSRWRGRKSAADYRSRCACSPPDFVPVFICLQPALSLHLFHVAVRLRCRAKSKLPIELLRVMRNQRHTPQTRYAGVLQSTPDKPCPQSSPTAIRRGIHIALVGKRHAIRNHPRKPDLPPLDNRCHHHLHLTQRLEEDDHGNARQEDRQIAEGGPPGPVQPR